MDDATPLARELDARRSPDPRIFGETPLDGNAEQNLLSAVIDTAGDTTILRLVGEIDISSAHVLATQFDELADRRPGRVLIDATSVTFMDSSGLHALIEGKRVLSEGGAKIALVPSSQVQRVLELVFPDPLFAFRCETVDEALSALA